MTIRCYPLSCLLAIIAVSFMCATAHADDQRELNLEQQPLADALRSVANEFDLEIAFFSETTNGIDAVPLAGDYTQAQAFDALLDDTSLEYEQLDNGTVVVRAKESGGDSDSKNLSPASILMAQNQTSQMQTTASSRSEEDGKTVVTGRVTDAQTGVNLKGALVTIEETGQSTSTDDLGVYRFSSVSSGGRTLRVSYLGYVDQLARIDAGQLSQITRNFALVGGDELEEIVVFGQRSARAQSLNKERAALNSSTVLAADILGQFNGTTISEALRRAPGIAFVPDPNTGEGAQVIVRGLQPDLNQVTLNGIRLLDGTGLGRSPDLGNILTENIESVTINKTLLPSQDSNGAGALIEIETKSPLDRSERFARFGVEYGERGGDFGDEFGANGTLSGIFGANRDFGASLSLSYRERAVTEVGYSLSGGAELLPGVLPAIDLSDSRADNALVTVDRTAPFPIEAQFNELYPSSVLSTQGSTDVETLSATASLQKQFGGHTDIRFDLFYSEDVTTTYSAITSIRSGRGPLSYDTAPVDELNGEIRPVLVIEDIGRNDPRNQLFFGDGILGGVSRDIRYAPDQESSVLSANLRGNSVVDNWEFDYAVGYSESQQGDGNAHSLGLGEQSFGVGSGIIQPPTIGSRSFLAPAALDNVTGDGRIVSLFPSLDPSSSNNFVLPLFSAEGFAFYNSANSFPLVYAVTGPRESSGEELSLDMSVKRNLDNSVFRYVSVGANYQGTDFFSPADPGTSALGQGIFSSAAGFSSADFGLAFGPGILSQVGADGDFASVTRGSAVALINSVDRYIADGSLLRNAESSGNLQSSRGTTEEILSVFVEGQIDIGKLEIIGGIRLDFIEVSSDFFDAPSVIGPSFEQLVIASEAGEFVSDSVSQTDVLPRILANYRFSDDMILRGGYYSTSSRPQLSNLTSRRNVELFLPGIFAPNGSLGIFEGNPDLEPAVTHNFNLDWEWYSDDIGVIKVATFYKVIENPLQNTRITGNTDLIPDDLELPDISFFNDLPDTIEVQFGRPENGEKDNEIWGFELVAERQLNMLPGAWSGLGIYANYAYTDSKGVQRIRVDSTEDNPEGFIEIDDVPFEGSPEHQGTFGLTYSKHSIDASLLYTAQSRRFVSIGRFRLDSYAEAVETLDLQIEYFREIAGRTLRFSFRAEDLLSGEEDPFLQTSVGGDLGVPEYFTGATYFGGRSFFAGVSVNF